MSAGCKPQLAQVRRLAAGFNPQWTTFPSTAHGRPVRSRRRGLGANSSFPPHPLPVALAVDEEL